MNIEKALTGRTIKAVVKNRFKTGRPNHPYTTDPRLLLDDGTVVRFNVVETETGDYGVEIIATYPVSKPKA